MEISDIPLPERERMFDEVVAVFRAAGQRPTRKAIELLAKWWEVTPPAPPPPPPTPEVSVTIIAADVQPMSPSAAAAAEAYRFANTSGYRFGNRRGF